MTETCETCRFLKSADEHGNGFCAKLPPTVHVVPIGDAPFADTYWALVTSGDWCGEFQPQGSPVEGIPGISWDWVKYWHAREMALADRALTPTPVAVSEMPVGYQQTEHDPESEARATLLAYNAAHPGAPMTWWPGGDKAPEDWDGGPYLCRDGEVYQMRGYGWKHGEGSWSSTAEWDRIGYRQTVASAPQEQAEAPEPAADLVVKVAEAFCAWPLPETFNPDGGVHFDGWIGNPGTKHEYRRQLTGTNLIGVSEAIEMVRWLLDRTGLRLVRDLSEEERRELADKMAREAYIKHCLHGDARGNREHLQAVFGPNHRPDFSHYAKSERYTARAAIDAVLGPVKGNGGLAHRSRPAGDRSRG